MNEHMGITPEEVEASNLDKTYNSLLILWTSGTRDYHSLISDYLTANSIFVAAIGFLFAGQPVTVFFSIVTIILGSVRNAHVAAHGERAGALFEPEFHLGMAAQGN
jgi:hypothetical protein